MLRLFKLLGPVGFILVGATSALGAAWLTGSRGGSLVIQALISVPISFLGLFIHDLMDDTLGLSSLESSLLIVACTTGCVAVILNALWLNRRN